MSNDKDYMREYMKRRYHEKRGEMLAKLGGKCTRCGSQTDMQIDHVDRTKKTMRVERMAYVNEERRNEELKNCQLLRGECHTAKTVIEDLGRPMARGTHGTLSALRYCKPPCEECRKAKNDYARKRREGRRQ